MDSHLKGTQPCRFSVSGLHSLPSTISLFFFPFSRQGNRLRSQVLACDHTGSKCWLYASYASFLMEASLPPGGPNEVPLTVPFSRTLTAPCGKDLGVGA